MKIQHTSRIFALALPLMAGLAVSATAQPRGNNFPNGRFDSRDDSRRGTVERIYSTREFDLRSVNGSLVRVKTDSYTNLRRGDFVTLRGDLRGNTFYADIVNRRDDNFPGNQGRERNVNFRGEVVDVEGNNQLRIRDRDGRIYLVRTVGRISRRISRGDEVSVSGRFDGSFVRAEDNDIVLLRNDNNYYDRDNYGGRPLGNRPWGNRPNGNRLEFSATVNYLNNRQLVVRADNGRTYTILVPQGGLGNLRPGDRVRVTGEGRGDSITASRVTRMR